MPLITFDSRDAQNLYYEVGDTEILGSNYVANGYITGSSKSILVNITFPKSIANITTISCTSFDVVIRGVGGFVGGSSFVEYVNRTGYTISCVVSGANSIRLRLDKSSEFSNATNNTPVSLDGTFEFSFS